MTCSLTPKGVVFHPSLRKNVVWAYYRATGPVFSKAERWRLDTAREFVVDMFPGPDDILQGIPSAAWRVAAILTRPRR